MQPIITSEELLNHWQGHRRLTRRVIETFPEDKFESYSIGGMRTASGLVQEMLSLGAPGLKGLITDEWAPHDAVDPDLPVDANSKKNILHRWDKATEEINALWPDLKSERFRETIKIFGMWESTVYSALIYFIENECHHRGQVYVYLRSLGIEPPPFYDQN